LQICNRKYQNYGKNAVFLKPHLRTSKMEIREIYVPILKGKIAIERSFFIVVDRQDIKRRIV